MDRSQLLRGALDAATLAVVADEDGYGYDVVRRLRAAGLSDVGDASVYGTLRRLYKGGSLTSFVVPSDEGPHRRYYGITQRGREQLDEARETWSDFSGALRCAIWAIAIPPAVIARAVEAGKRSRLAANAASMSVRLSSA